MVYKYKENFVKWIIITTFVVPVRKERALRGRNQLAPKPGRDEMSQESL